MNRRISFWVLGSSFLTLSLAALPAAGQTTVEERTETYRSGPAAMPTAAPAPMVEHRTETTIEQHAPPPPPPPPVVEKRTYEEKVEH